MRALSFNKPMTAMPRKVAFGGNSPQVQQLQLQIPEAFKAEMLQLKERAARIPVDLSIPVSAYFVNENFPNMPFGKGALTYYPKNEPQNKFCLEYTKESEAFGRYDYEDAFFAYFDDDLNLTRITDLYKDKFVPLQGAEKDDAIRKVQTFMETFRKQPR